MKPSTRAWLLAFVLLGLIGSLMSFYVQYRMLRDPTYSSFCNFNPPFNCDAVYQSRFSAFYDVPSSLGGVIWFTLALLLTFRSDTKSGTDQSGAMTFLFVMSMPAVSVMVFLAYVSIIIVKAVGILCVLGGIGVIGVFFISGASTSIPLAGLPRQILWDARALTARPVGLLVTVMFVATSACAVVFSARTVGQPTAALTAVLAQQPNDFDLWFESQVRTPVGLPNDSAQVVIVKFNDYLSAACAETYKTDSSVLAKYQMALPGRVKFVLKDFPQDPACNPTVAAPVHEAACEASAAVRLAERRQRGAALEEWLYTHQVGLTFAAVRQAAEKIGGIDDFDSDYSHILASIESDVDLGRRLGVRGTPTLFINGVKVEGGLKPELLDQAIAHELRVTAKR